LFLIVVATALLIALGWFAALTFKAVRASRPQTVVLADGSRFTLLGVSAGDQPFTTEKPWQKSVRRVLPRQWHSWLPDVISAPGSGSSNSLIVWFTLLDAKGANVSSPPWTWLAPIGEDGFRWPPSGGSGTRGAGRIVVHTAWLDAFPRRQAEFDVRLLDNNGLLVGTIRVANPFRGPFTEWKPEQLPITRTNGPLTVTLESLSEHTNPSPTYSGWISAEWKMETTDPLWRGAKPSYQQWSDATGNRGGRLSYQEGAWKLELPFRRPNPANYLETEKFTLRDLSVPEPGTFQVLTNEIERLGVKFKIRCLVGAGTLAITNGTNFGMLARPPGSGWSTTTYEGDTIETWASLKPFFLIETSRPDPLDDLRFSLAGSDGRNLPLESSGWSGSAGGGRRYQQKFDATNGVSSVTLEGIVSYARLVEFIVSPAEVRRAGAAMR
jgi:hypothetical protein